MPIGPDYRSAIVFEDVNMKKLRMIGKKIDLAIKRTSDREKTVTVLFSSDLGLTNREIIFLRLGYVYAGWDTVTYNFLDDKTIIRLTKN